MDRALEAADLFAEGYAPLVIVSRQWPDRAMVILEERGIPFLDDADRIQQALVALGLPEDALLVPPTRHDNTAHEAQTVRSLTAARGWETVIVVSSKYHLRRAGFAMRRELEGTGVQVVMRGTRYDPHDPARWWATRTSVRAVVPEIYGYLAYVMGLGA